MRLDGRGWPRLDSAHTPMIYEGHLFDFPGLSYLLRHEDIASSAQEAVLRAVSAVVEPTVVEATDERRSSSHLVVGDAKGGSYIRHPMQTTTVPRIDEAQLLAWFHDLARGGAPTLTELRIADGWYFVDAHVGDTIHLHETGGSYKIAIVEHAGRPSVPGPTDLVMDAPLRFELYPDAAELRIDVQWSPWTDADGVGRGRFQRMLAELAAAGWVLEREPPPEDLVWRRSPARAPGIPSPLPPAVSRPPPAATPTWASVGATRVVLGLGDSERDALVETLVETDRAAFESLESFGFREYDEPKRRGEIRAGLATSLGHAEVYVASFEIMRRPVTNDLWRAYMVATGASRPATWPASGMPPRDEPVVGISADEAAAFAAHHGWSLPSEGEWQLAARIGGMDPLGYGTTEYTRDAFAPYPEADLSAFEAVAAGWQHEVCLRGSAPKVPPCIESRCGLARDRRFKFACFRCVRRSRLR